MVRHQVLGDQDPARHTLFTTRPRRLHSTYMLDNTNESTLSFDKYDKIGNLPALLNLDEPWDTRKPVEIYYETSH